jgi:hypothetical protein
MGNELAISTSFNAFTAMAKKCHASGLYPNYNSEDKIFAILMTAHELNVGYMMALNGGLSLIKGRVELSARLLNSMLRKAGIRIVITQSDIKGCILEGTRPDTGDTCIAQFLEEDARRAGLLGKDNWKMYPADMYFARAISILARRLAPDTIGESYVQGEISELGKPNPEQLEPSKDVEVSAIPYPGVDPKDICLPDTSNQISEEQYYLSWGEDKPIFLKLMEDKLQSPKMTKEKFLKYCIDNPDKTKQAVSDYKQDLKKECNNENN